MVKSDDRRAALLDRFADFVLTEGLPAASLRPLAQAAGISDRMLLYYFKDKAEVIAATLELVAQRFAARLQERAPATPLPLEPLRAELWTILSAAALWPYMCIWLEAASLSARGDPVYRAVGERIGRGFLAWGESLLDSPTPATRRADAARLLVMIEGMVLLKSLGLDDACRDSL